MFQAASQLLSKIKTLRAIITQKLELGVELSTVTASAISVSVPVTVITTATSETRTLAAGTPGQIKVIVMKTDNGACVVTVTSLNTGTTLTFDDVNDTWVGIYYAGVWQTLLLSATLG